MYYSLNKLGIGNYLIENYEALLSDKQLFRILKTNRRIEHIMSAKTYRELRHRDRDLVGAVHCGSGTGGSVYRLEVFNWKPPNENVFAQRRSMLTDYDSDE